MTAGGIITALIVGLIIGALGRLAVPGRQNIPIWLTLVIGVVAALLGSAIARAGGFADTGGWIDWRELLLQIALAAVGVLLTVTMYGRAAAGSAATDVPSRFNSGNGRPSGRPFPMCNPRTDPRLCRKRNFRTSLPRRRLPTYPRTPIAEGNASCRRGGNHSRLSR